jgi:hypothetical protein
MTGQDKKVNADIEIRTCRDGDDGVGDLLAEVRLSGLLHLTEDHRRDLLGGELALLVAVLDADRRLAVLLLELERPVLHVAFDVRVVHLAADEPLRVEDGVLRVRVECVLGGVTDQALLFAERDP